MKILQMNKEIESIQLKGIDEENLSIWLPTNVEVSFDEVELNEDENKIYCNVTIHCKAEIDNINIIQEAMQFTGIK